MLAENNCAMEAHSMKALSRHFRGMGSPCHIYLVGFDETLLNKAADDALSEINRLEQKYSRYREDSYLSAINQSSGTGQYIDLDEETYGLIEYADELNRRSDGLFDITSGVLREIWDYSAGRLPDSEEIDGCLRKVGWHKVEWSEKGIKLPLAGMQIDFGGYVKEYAADSAARICRSLGVVNGYIDLGGDIAVVGPPPDLPTWLFGVRHPRKKDTPISHIELERGALTTSGDYERFMQVGDVHYSHLLNPKTAIPLTSKECFCSVSVMAEQAIVAGTISTVAMLKGVTEGRKWLRESRLSYLIVHQDMTVESNY